MGCDINIVKKGLDCKVREIYHATYHATCNFENQSVAFKELISFANGDKRSYPCELTPTEYSPLIPKFEQEKKQLEMTGQTQKGQDVDSNTITLYDVVEGCYSGLKRAKTLRAKVRIS